MAVERDATPTSFDIWCETSTVENKIINCRWDIKNYRTVKNNHPQGQRLQSGDFSLKVNDTLVKFWLVFYPNGEKVDPENIYGEDNDVFLSLESDDSPENSENVRLTPAFSIIDSSGKKHLIGICSDLCLGLPYTDGYQNFINDDDLFGPGSTLLKDGTLTFLCEITVKFGDVVCKKIKETKIVEEDTSHCEDMMRMLVNADEHHADIQIKCKDGVIPVHSSLLSARSEVFKAMLSHDMEEKRTGEISKLHLQRSFVFIILEFIYTGKVDPNKISLQLLEESNEMRLIELKKICCKHLIKEINMTNCVKYLVTADRLSAADLKGATQNFIMANFTDMPAKAKKDLEGHPSLLSEICSALCQQAPTAVKRQRVE